MLVTYTGFYKDTITNSLIKKSKSFDSSWSEEEITNSFIELSESDEQFMYMLIDHK